MPRLISCVIAGLMLGSAVRVPGQKHTDPKKPAGSVEIQMRNVNLRLTSVVTLQVRSMRGRLVPVSENRPVTLDASDSFYVIVDTAVMALSTDSLTQLLNTFVFAYPGAPLKHITMSAKGSRLVQKGTMHKGVDLPYEMEGEVSVTTDGNLRLHVDKIKSEHIPFKGLLHLFGEGLSKLINLNEARGVRMEGDDILMYPDRMMPAPHLHGRITAVRVEGNNIVQSFGSERPAQQMRLPEAAANYIYHRGGILRFGKLTMTDADLEIVDQNSRTPFDFSLPEYNRQLVAGYSKNTPAKGLVVHMPDFSQVKK